MHILVSFFLCFALSCSSKDQSATINSTRESVSIDSAENWAASAATEFKGNSTITGRVLFTGVIPTPKLIKMDKNPACCPEGAASVQSPEIAINSDSTLKNVFVYIKEGLPTRRFPPPTSPVVLDQRNCFYEPRVFGIQAGQPLKILNSDRTFHNVHASAQKNASFNLAMSAVMKVRERSFDHPEVMIPIRCNVHPWMIAYAGVLDHPFYDVTDGQGTYSLGAVPAGEYLIEAWHERLGTLSQTIKLGEAETPILDFIFQ